MPKSRKLKNGDNREFAFLSIDIIDHSSLSTKFSAKDISYTITVFHSYVKGHVDCHSGTQISWEGDGGVFYFLQDTEADKACDWAFLAAKEILFRLDSFNHSMNILKVHLSVRIGIDFGSAVYKKSAADIHSDALNSAAKIQRKASSNSIVITDGVFKNLSRENQEFFMETSDHYEGRKLFALHQVGRDVDQPWPMKEDLIDISVHLQTNRDMRDDFVRNIDLCFSYADRLVNEKYMYTGIEEAHAWKKLCDDPLYSVYRDSLSFFEQEMQDILDTVYAFGEKEISFVSLGVGSGGKENLFLTNLLKRQENLFFYLVDSSIEMLCLSLVSFVEHQHKYQNRVKFKGIYSDFAHIPAFALIDYSGSKRRLFALLGNTIGNDREEEFLNPIHEMMGENDLLLLDAQTIPPSVDLARFMKKVESSYDLQTFKDFVTTPLVKLKINPGISGHVRVFSQEGHPYHAFSQASQRAFTIFYDFVFDEEYRWEEMNRKFHPGHGMRLGHSIKYSIEAFEHVVCSHGFEKVATFSSADINKPFGAIIVKKHSPAATG